MWECDWERLKKEDPAVKAFITDRQRPCDGQFKMTEETILRAVMEDRMFGTLEVDLEVPDHLKGKFAEMPPVFKNTHVSRDDFSKGEITMIFSPYILPIRHFLFWFTIPRSSAYVFMWSPMSSLETCVFLKTGGISANFPFKWSGTSRSTSKVPNIRS
jgi:hypothetical protein